MSVVILSLVPDTADDRIARRSAEIDRSLNEQSASHHQESTKIMEQTSTDQRNKLTENVRSQLVCLVNLLS